MSRGPAGPGGRIGVSHEGISKELLDLLAVADNIHDFSSERGKIPNEVEIIRPVYRATDDGEEEIKEKPTLTYRDSIAREPLVMASHFSGRMPIEISSYRGGKKIRIIKKTMRNVYLDEMEKEIIRWGIKKGYIHKSNYLDLDKLLED